MVALVATILGIAGLFIVHPDVHTFPFWALLVLTVLSFAHVWVWAPWPHNQRNVL